jgi:two-component system NarL family response regulator
MPGIGGLDVLRALKGRADAPKVIVLTSYETDEDIYRAVEAGARGYLLKNTSETEMLSAIHAVHGGRRFFPPSVAARLVERLARASLTARENEILELLAKGLTNRQIGNALHISEHTARNHVNSIIDKLGVSDRTEAVITALQQGLVMLQP